MFKSLKNRIREETGEDITSQHQQQQQQQQQKHQQKQKYEMMDHNRNSMMNYTLHTIPLNDTNDNVFDDVTFETLKSNEMMANNWLTECQNLTLKVHDLEQRIETVNAENTQLRKTNEILMETIKVAQEQKNLYCNEQEQIQNMQELEIEKLRHGLTLRENEALERLKVIGRNEQQIDYLNNELRRLKSAETELEELKDELQTLQHKSQMTTNTLTSSLAAFKEENAQLKKRVEIMEMARIDVIQQMNTDDRVQALMQEHKLLEQHLEETRLQLSDIKSVWSKQNMTLETQVQRLSKRAAEEAIEKSALQTENTELFGNLKEKDIKLKNSQTEIQQRNDKIKLLEEEIEELNLALKESREKSTLDLTEHLHKVRNFEAEFTNLKEQLAAEQAINNDCLAKQTIEQLNQQIKQLEHQLAICQGRLDEEKQNNLTALLKNAEISQNADVLHQQLRTEREDSNELRQNNQQLIQDMDLTKNELNAMKTTIENLQITLKSNESKLEELDEFQRELSEKNRTIKILNQHLVDLKKIIQMEFNNRKLLEEVNNKESNRQGIAGDTNRNKNCNFKGLVYVNGVTVGVGVSGGNDGNGIVMDEVNFKYLKHVVFKFLTSREVEARHLIRAVVTLLKLNKDEERQLQDTLNWKTSWFGSKTYHNGYQYQFPNIASS